MIILGRDTHQAMQRIRSALAGARRSWTIRLNVTVGALAASLPVAQDAIPQLQAYLPADVYRYAMAAVVLGNILLRIKTNKPLSER